MSHSFAELFEASLNETPMIPGAIITGKIVRIDHQFVVVSAGLKSESIIPIDQFQDEHGKVEISVGDEVLVALDSIEDGSGVTRLSRERAKRQESWIFLEKAFEKKENVTGVVQGRVKGGFTVEINKIRAFLPGSLVDVKPVRDPETLEGKTFEFKVIKIDAKRNNIVVSRRLAMESENSVERETLLENLHENDEVTGIVKNLTDYGAFIDLGGVDGLLHITDMSWKRIKHPSEILNIGDEIKVKILKFDRATARVSLGLKQLGDDPWAHITIRHPIGQRLEGRVTNITDYGCFVEIEEGIEGLVHVSEMDWTNKNVNPNKAVHLGQEVEVIVLDIDGDRRRISLGLKQCTENPWKLFSTQHQKGDKITAKIKSITDFGIFIGLDGGIDGLIHLSDISWNEAATEEVIRQHQKGDELETVILAIDADRERISLGLKQLADDPVALYLNSVEKGAMVSGQVAEVDAKLVMIELAPGVLGSLRASDISLEKVEDARTQFKVGDTVEARMMGTDRKTQMIMLSIKAPAVTAKKPRAAKEKMEDKSGDGMKTTLGDLMKASMKPDSDA